MKQSQFAKLVNVSPSYISILIKNNKLSTYKNGEINEDIGLLEFTLLKGDDTQNNELVSRINELINNINKVT